MRNCIGGLEVDSRVESKVLQVEGQVEEVMFDHLHATAFQYSPLSRTILGPAENIHTITQADLKSYISTHYTGPRMVSCFCQSCYHLAVIVVESLLLNKEKSEAAQNSIIAAV